MVGAWLLMQQPLTTQESERALRPARRRLSKAGLPAEDVNLIEVAGPDDKPVRGTERVHVWDR